MLPDLAFAGKMCYNAPPFTLPVGGKPMRAIDIIATKRDGGSLTADELDFFVQGLTQGDIPDYQVAAWLMAIFVRGMTPQETTDLTLAMVRSGEVLDLSTIAPFVVDKHSSGGVGDKTSLVVVPLVAAAGIPVGKMSGRGLGFAGGTLDKLESIQGFRSDLTQAQFRAQLERIGLVLASQSADLAPADGKLYALRDATSTVGSLPLIASSIMSKKIAAGANGIVLDVKVGHGAFMRTRDEARRLAQLMVQIGKGPDRQVRAVISDMNQPLGWAVGNAVEVREAIDTLHGGGPPDFREHCLAVASEMLALPPGAEAASDRRARLMTLLDEGAAWSTFREWIAAQGGDLRDVDSPERMPSATLQVPFPAPATGYVAGMNAREVGLTSMILGGGRAKKGDPIDHAVGVLLHAKVGDHVEAGQPVFSIHANHPDRLAQAKARLGAALTWSNDPVSSLPLIHEIVA
jgi:pyrimidine-nucleoside phosphorylase